MVAAAVVVVVVVGMAQKGGKEAKSVTYEMEMTVSCVSQFVLFPTNLILSRAPDTR